MAGGLNRRHLVAGLALTTAPVAAAAAAQPNYGYAFLDLKLIPGESATAALRAHLAGQPLAAAGGKVVAAFVPQLGWKSSEVALLIDQGQAGPLRTQDLIASGPKIATCDYHRLTPTARPSDDSPPRPGGIYVHRWFVVQTSDVPEVVELSALGWRDFERRFDTQIYGLFAAEPTLDDRGRGQTRLLLMTRYRDHGVWEVSRDPSTEAMAAFARRARLTRSSWAASTLMISTTP